MSPQPAPRRPISQRSGNEPGLFVTVGRWVGEAERALRVTFEQAYLHQPSIIFFDEIDGLAPVRSSKQDQIHSSVVSTLLGLMDGIQSRGKVVVIGATNRIDSIDPALRRPGRFDREFVFPLPSVRARRQILDIHTKGWSPPPSEATRQAMAEACAGYCGADLKAVCAEAALHAVQRRYPQIYHSDQKLLIDPEAVTIEPADFLAATRKVVPAAHRSAAKFSNPMPAVLQPILSAHVAGLLQALQSAFFPFCPPSASFRSAGDASMGGGDAGGGGGGGFGGGMVRPPPAWTHIHIHGPADSGQAEVAQALLDGLDQVPVHGLDLPSLLGSHSTSTMEQAAVSAVREAGQVTPSILYLPHLQLWGSPHWSALRAALWTALGRLPRSVLLLTTSDLPAAEVDSEALELLLAHGLGTGMAVPLGRPSAASRRQVFGLALNDLNTVVPTPRLAVRGPPPPACRCCLSLSPPWSAVPLSCFVPSAVRAGRRVAAGHYLAERAGCEWRGGWGKGQATGACEEAGAGGPRPTACAAPGVPVRAGPSGQAQAVQALPRASRAGGLPGLLRCHQARHGPRRDLR